MDGVVHVGEEEKRRSREEDEKATKRAGRDVGSGSTFPTSHRLYLSCCVCGYLFCLFLVILVVHGRGLFAQCQSVFIPVRRSLDH